MVAGLVLLAVALVLWAGDLVLFTASIQLLVLIRCPWLLMSCF